MNLPQNGRPGGGIPIDRLFSNGGANQNRPQQKPSVNNSQSQGRSNLASKMNGANKPVSHSVDTSAPKGLSPLQDFSDEMFTDLEVDKDSYDDIVNQEEDNPFEHIPMGDFSFLDDDKDDFENVSEQEVTSKPVHTSHDSGSVKPNGQREVAREPKSPEQKTTVSRVRGDTRIPVSKVKQEEFSDSFVDKENVKLKPFGKKVKVGDFDSRNNLESKRKFYRGLFIFGLVAVIGFGAYQTFFPKNILSPNEVEQIAMTSVGETAFPKVRGEGFAVSFIDTLINYSGEDVDRAHRSVALSYFYGRLDNARTGESGSEFVNFNGNFKQNVVHGPVIVSSRSLTDNAGSFQVGVLMRTSNLSNAENKSLSDKAEEELRWTVFNVNVYYNAETDSLAIAPGSPTLLPANNVVANSEVPKAQPLGTDFDDYPESIKATVHGFLNGYRTSSKSDWERIRQYIGSDADESLKNGLNSRFDFIEKDNPASSIKSFEVFATDETHNVLKVDLTVEWVIPGENSNIGFPSRYVVTLEKVSGNDYRVTKFAPYYWVESIEG